MTPIRTQSDFMIWLAEAKQNFGLDLPATFLDGSYQVRSIPSPLPRVLYRLWGTDARGNQTRPTGFFWFDEGVLSIAATLARRDLASFTGQERLLRGALLAWRLRSLLAVRSEWNTLEGFFRLQVPATSVVYAAYGQTSLQPLFDTPDSVQQPGTASAQQAHRNRAQLAAGASVSRSEVPAAAPPRLVHGPESQKGFTMVVPADDHLRNACVRGLGFQYVFPPEAYGFGAGREIDGPHPFPRLVDQVMPMPLLLSSGRA